MSTPEERMRNKARAAAKAAAKAAPPQDRRGDQKPKKAAPKAQARQARAQDAPPAPKPAPAASDAAALQAMFASFLASQGLSAAAQPAAEVEPEPEVEVEPERVVEDEPEGVVEDEPERRRRDRGRGRHHGAPTAAQLVRLLRWVIVDDCSFDSEVDLPKAFEMGILREVSSLTRDLRTVASPGSSSSSSDVPSVPKPPGHDSKPAVSPIEYRTDEELVGDLTQLLDSHHKLPMKDVKHILTSARAHINQNVYPKVDPTIAEGIRKVSVAVCRRPTDGSTPAKVARLLLDWYEALAAHLPKASEMAEAVPEDSAAKAVPEPADPLSAD